MNYDLQRYFAVLEQIRSLIRTNPQIAFEKVVALREAVKAEFPLGDDPQENLDRFTLLDLARRVRNDAVMAGGDMLAVRNPGSAKPSEPLAPGSNVIRGRFGRKPT